MKEVFDNKIVECTDERLYYLNNPHLLCSSHIGFEKNVKFLDKTTNKIIRKDVLLSEALMKMIAECIDNVIDVNIKSKGKYANKLDISLDRETNYIAISDNGIGFNSLDDLVLATTKFRTSSNYAYMENEDNSHNSGAVGRHGLGLKLDSCLSKFIQYESINLNNEKAVVICKNNMETIESYSEKAKKSETNGFKVTMLPDYKRFKMEGLTDDIENHLKAILINIAYANPQITFTFNGKKLQVKKFQEFMKYYSDDFSILVNDDKLSLAVYPTEQEHQFVYIVNSLDLSKGGNALEYITNNISKEFANRLKKRYSKIQNNSVKQKIGVCLVIKNAVNLRFGGGQTKDELKNTVTELGLPTLQYESFAEIMFKNQSIKQPIIEMYQALQEIENKKLNAKIKADKKEIFNPKHLKATDKNEFLFIAEGDSALASLPIALGRTNKGYLSLTGKLMNALKSTSSQLLKNQRVVDIVEAFGIGLEKTRYENVVITSDADLDGEHIASLLVCLFYKMQPEILKNGRMYRLKTPIISILKGDKLINWFYTISDFKKAEKDLPKGVSKMYMKGLGSWSAEHYKTVFARDGLDKCLERIEFKEGDEEIIESWMSDEGIEFRKNILAKESFSLDSL